MNIFYDHQAFSAQNFGGVSRIFSELITGIPEVSNHHVHLSLLVSNNIYLEQKKIPHKTFLPSLSIPRKFGIMNRINQVYNEYDIKRNKFDVYHPTYYDPRLVKYVGNIPVVATFHDMTQEIFISKYEDLAAEKNTIENKRKIAKVATHIIAVSENTKNDLVNILGVDPKKITVVYLGNSFSSENISLHPSEVKTQPYLLYVGNRSAYKNFIPFIKAIAGLLKRYNIQLKCAGGKMFSEAEMQIIKQLGVMHLVYIEPTTSDTKLSNLYSNALAFVFPSLYEGFGIPILEAFACSCPCILSNSSSLPEVAKDAAVYFDPGNSFSIANAVEKVLNNAALRNELVVKGKERLQYFSWGRHVQETISVYENL